jgi:hypothetical protein
MYAAQSGTQHAACVIVSTATAHRLAGPRHDAAIAAALVQSALLSAVVSTVVFC